jgi:hypothetical protein
MFLFDSRRVQFTEFIQKNLHLYQFRNTIPLSTAATANFTRGELATALRKVPIRLTLLFPFLSGCTWVYKGLIRVDWGALEFNWTEITAGALLW